MNPIVGIDLGTTNSAIAILRNNEVDVIPNEHGDNTTPSVVAFTTQTLVGKLAKNQAVANPSNTIASVKRLIGRRVSELPAGVKKTPYTLVGRASDPVQILVENPDATSKIILMPQDISAHVLANLKKNAETYLKTPIHDAVITVPAYFNDGQRQATKKAGELAGFNVKRIINEPTAAALAYGLREDSSQEKKIAVFDLGGGTFDISILEIGHGIFEVKSTNGDTFLGGNDFDMEITNMLLRSFNNKFNIDLRNHPSAHQKIRDAAEKAKCELSDMLETKISLSFETVGPEARLEITLTRVKFESLIEKYLKRIEICCKQALVDAKLKVENIDDVVMVGGATRTPIIRALAQKIFKRIPNTSVNPDEVVAIGAAVQGAILTGQKKDAILVDITPFSLGLETEDDLMDILIPKNTPIPCVKKDIFTTADDNQDEVDVFIYQGENKKVAKNRLLGQFVLDGIEPSLSGEPQIEVKFAIDTNGILNVSAKNLGTGSEQHITIKDSSKLSGEDIEKMKFSNENEDDEIDLDKEMTLEELITVGESLLKDTNTSLNEIGEILDKNTLQKVKATKESLAEALDANDKAKIQQDIEILLELWDEIEKSLD